MYFPMEAQDSFNSKEYAPFEGGAGDTYYSTEGAWDTYSWDTYYSRERYDRGLNS